MCKRILIIFMMIIPLCLPAQENKESRKVELDDGSFVVPDKYPEIIKYAKPKFPKQAILQDIQGKVYVKVTIDEKGKVAGIQIVKGGDQSLNAAAIDAAKQMQFTPAIIKGKAVKSSIAVPISFVLDPGKSLPLGEQKDELKTEKVSPPGNIRDLFHRSPNYGVKKEKEADPDSSKFTPVEKEPAPITFVKPVYPELAVKSGITGIVILRVLVSKEGKPVRVVVFKADNEMFIEPAKKAAMETIFSPAILAGKPIACWLNMPYKFSLGDGPKKK